MKIIYLLFLSLTVASVIATADVPTVRSGFQWAYSLGTGVFPYQVVSDGAGGVVICYPSEGVYVLVWLDRNGNVLQTHTTMDSFPTIISAQRRAFVFFYQSGPDYVIVTAHRNGQTRITSATDTDFFDFPAMAFNLRENRPGDRRGYFATRVNKASSHVHIERYTYR